MINTRNTSPYERKARRVALHGVVNVALAALLWGCAAQGAPSQGASNQGIGGSRVEVYGEIDMGYGASRTKTTLPRK